MLSGILEVTIIGHHEILWWDHNKVVALAGLAISCGISVAHAGMLAFSEKVICLWCVRSLTQSLILRIQDSNASRAAMIDRVEQCCHVVLFVDHDTEDSALYSLCFLFGRHQSGKHTILSTIIKPQPVLVS